MKNRTILTCALLIFSAFSASSQTDLDAFRYSQSGINGTARYTGMAGAFGALGGDFSCLANNPAGIGIYRKSEISFTPSIYVGSTDANFLGKSNLEKKFNFNFGNAGMVYTAKLTNNEESPGWKSINFGFGYNRISNFHNRSFYENTNPSNSMTDYFAENAQGLSYENLDPFFEYLAYYNYLINPDSANHYSPAVPDGNILQRRNFESRGSVGEVDITLGGNYSNKLYLGGSIGFSSLRYVEESTYEEVDQQKIIDTLSQFSFDQYLKTKGSGVNFKFGLIYKPIDWVRIGVAVHSPTWYTMRDEYNSVMKARFDGGYSDSKESPAGSFDYNLTTPFKAIGSLAFIIDKYGLLSADYEITDYSQARLDASGVSFTDENNNIRNKYTTASTVRIGTEWRIGNLSLRGGTAFTTSPMNAQYTSNGADYKKTSYSGGFGIRDNDLFIDFGYIYSQSNEYYKPYTLSNESVPGVHSTTRTNNFTVTFGVKF